VGGLLLPGRELATSLVAATDYTRVIVFDGVLLLGSALSVGLVRVSSIGKTALIIFRYLMVLTEGGLGKNDFHFNTEIVQRGS
jgi:hypothetical protein